MFTVICKFCKNEIRQSCVKCPHCHTALVWSGTEKNIIDSFVPNCLAHRYEGSDLLEPAFFLKKGKVNFKVAVANASGIKLATVAKAEVFRFDTETYDAISALRDKRCALMRRFDRRIGACWEKLSPFCPESLDAHPPS